MTTHIRVATVALTVFVLLLGAFGSYAQSTDGLYIQLNHGNISVTDAETPNIVAQFGNRSQQTLSGVGVVCGWAGNIRGIADDTGFVSQNGPFGEPSLFTPPNTVGTPFEGLAIFLWDGRVDLRPGQNFNVSFGIRFVNAVEDGSELLQCFAVTGEGDLASLSVAAESNVVPVEIRRTSQPATPAEEQSTDGLYIQLNHGNISVTDAETPNIVAQFGNRSQQTLSGVGVVCGWAGNIRGIADDTGFVSQNGPFGEPSLFTPPNTVGTPFEGLAIFLWDGRVDLRPGQNFNVSFGIRFVNAVEDGSELLQCFAVTGEGDLASLSVAAESNIVPVEIRR